MTIAQRYDRGTNGITALRGFLAVSVLMSHAWLLGGFGPDPLMTLTGARIDGSGTLAVLGFFGLSGFLLVESRQRTSTGRFLWNRALRILPGYWVLVLISAIFIGPAYLWSVALPLDGVGGQQWAGFADNPGSGLINGSLWTLWPEIVCYAALAAVPVRALRIVMPVVCVAIATVIVMSGGDASHPRLFEAFAIGALLSQHRDRVPLVGIFAIAGLAVMCLTVDTVAGALLAPIAMAYAAVWAGARLPLRWTTDVSYGIYIYAYPIAQALLLLGARELGAYGFAVLCFVATLPVAIASWYLIERPALRLKRIDFGLDLPLVASRRLRTYVSGLVSTKPSESP